ncbi:GL14270 [Drosophila persimilis]|uniref:GL14270 n=1 Tax=Drosophila persimilis TaxID=7234 RepID=B4GTI0_DROPE|nr:GL14270 [Drosophila persimilis]
MGLPRGKCCSRSEQRLSNVGKGKGTGMGWARARARARALATFEEPVIQDGALGLRLEWGFGVAKVDPVAACKM